METIATWFKTIWHSLFGEINHEHFVPIPRNLPVIQPENKQAEKETTETIAPPSPIIRKNRRANLKALMDNIESAFNGVQLPTDYSWSHTDKDTIIGLRKLGPHISAHVKNKELLPSEELKLKITDKTRWFGLMFCADPDATREPIPGWMNVSFTYASKVKKPPWCVEQKVKGIIYECGAAWKCNKTKKLVWGCWYVSVNGVTGDIKVLQVLRYDDVTVHGVMYTKKHWGKTPMADSEFSNTDKDRNTDVLKSIFIRCYESWVIQETEWKVCVQKAGGRVTWTIPFEETKTYFIDRDMAVMDKNGNKKKIVHHVNQHTRNLASGKLSKVREHIRGINHFNWKGYDVTVIAPKFHVNAYEWDLSGEQDEDCKDKTNVVYTSKLGKMLADVEVQPSRKPLPDFVETP